MTAWQDQPPLNGQKLNGQKLNNQQLSRRQARQNERGEAHEGSASDVQVDVAHQTGEQADFVGFPREGWDTEARRVAAVNSAPRDNSPRDGGGVPSGRRSQRAFQPVERAEASEGSSEAEPLTYLTQGRQQVPSVDAQASAEHTAEHTAEQPTFRRRSVSAVPDLGTEQPAYRVRDFSPEGRRAAFSSTTPEPSAAPADLEYRTHGSLLPPPRVSPDAVASDAPAVDAQAVDASAIDSLDGGTSTAAAEGSIDSTPVQSGSTQHEASTPVEERTLSRREIRALENARAARLSQETAIPAQVDPFAALGLPAVAAPTEASSAAGVGIPELIEPVQPLRRDRIRQRSSEPDSAAVEASAEFDAIAGLGAAQSDITAPDITTPDITAPDITAPDLIAPEVAAPEYLTEPAPTESANPFESLLSGRTETAPAERPTSYTPPVGHWSTQASIDDDEQVQEITLSRNIGATSGAITTNALVIPSMPLEDALKPFGSTGEILITGSIDLPRSLGATGAHPARYDHSDVDALLEAGDREDAANPDSAPVRAIRAVSTHTSTRGVMESKKPKGNSRLPMILAVAAAAMAVGVVVLVVAGMIFGIFK